MKGKDKNISQEEFEMIAHNFEAKTEMDLIRVMELVAGIENCGIFDEEEIEMARKLVGYAMWASTIMCGRAIEEPLQERHSELLGSLKLMYQNEDTATIKKSIVDGINEINRVGLIELAATIEVARMLETENK